MIIEAEQLTSNIKQSYEISYNNEYYCYGTTGRFHAFQEVRLEKDDQPILTAHYHPCHWTFYIPFRYLFGMPNLSKAFSVQKDETNIGSFLLSHCGIAKHFHSIVSNESIFHCYSRSIDLFNYLSIYDTHTDKQIALLETYLTVVDNNYKFKLYLLDEYAAHTDVFALFILYYANFHFTQRFHMSAGTTSTRSWTFSGFNSKYDPDWRAKYFPNDNFWGKIDPYET